MRKDEDMNSVMLRGRTIGEPTVNFTKDGRVVASVLISVPDRSAPRTKEGYYQTDVLKLVAFNAIGNVIQKYVSKGTELLVNGKLSSSSYEKDNVTIYSTEIIVSQLEFVGNKSSDEEQKTKSRKTS